MTRAKAELVMLRSFAAFSFDEANGVSGISVPAAIHDGRCARALVSGRLVSRRNTERRGYCPLLSESRTEFFLKKHLRLLRPPTKHTSPFALSECSSLTLSRLRSTGGYDMCGG